jgi:hypothetical protein
MATEFKPLTLQNRSSSSVKNYDLKDKTLAPKRKNDDVILISKYM